MTSETEALVESVADCTKEALPPREENMTGSETTEAKAAVRRALACLPPLDARLIFQELYQEFNRDPTASPARVDGERISDGLQWFTRAELLETFDGDGDLVRPLMDALAAAELERDAANSEASDRLRMEMDARQELGRLRPVVDLARAVSQKPANVEAAESIRRLREELNALDALFGTLILKKASP